LTAQSNRPAPALQRSLTNETAELPKPILSDRFDWPGQVPSGEVNGSVRGSCCVLLVSLVFVASCPGSLAAKAEQQGPRHRSLADTLGVVHVAGRYHLTSKDFLNEGADAILQLGSRVIKVWFYGKRHEHPERVYPYNSNWPKVHSLVEGAQTPYFKALFQKPFTTYILVVTSLGRPDDYWRDRISQEQIIDEQRQFYQLTKYLLTAYANTHKTFILQHWEGDWMARGNFDWGADPKPQALKNMIAWLNARQAGVDRARREVGSHGVKVYHAAEVNRVVSSMRQGRPNMVNKVLPSTKVDLVSYSAWDSVTDHYNDPAVLRQALQYIADHAPDSADFGDRNVYIGEFGMPENYYKADQIRTAITNAVQAGLQFGCPYIVYWQLYCNELAGNAKPPVSRNDAVKGFWLIRPDGSKSWVWHYFHELLVNEPDVVQQR